jgi:hypothetical protein
VDPRDRIKFGVGGFLPNQDHAVIGISDFAYGDAADTASVKFCTEMKTRESYPYNEPWYRKSRACQAIAALYFCATPLLLCSPAAFKLLIESADRDCVFGYPEGYYNGNPSDDDFAYVVGLLILANRDFNNKVPIKLPVTLTKKSVNSIPSTVEKRKDMIPTRRSKRIANSQHLLVAKGQPGRVDEFINDGRIFFLSDADIQQAFASKDSSATDENPLTGEE